MNAPGDSIASDRLLHLVQTLNDTPGMAGYTEIFPRLSSNHLLSLTNDQRTSRQDAAELITAAVRQGPSDLAIVAQVYRERGELPALRVVADIETVAAATMEWHREIDQLLGLAEHRAVLWDEEGIRCADGLTWTKRVRDLRDRVATDYAASPASQKVFIETCLREMDLGLAAEKEHLRCRLERTSGDVQRNRYALMEDVYRQAERQAADVLREIDGDNLMIALRKLAVLEALIRGRAISTGEGGGRRLPLAQRRQPATSW